GGETLGLRRLDRRREELLLTARRLELGDLGLLLDDRLRRFRLRERAGLRGLGLHLRGDLQRLRARDLAVALGLDDHSLRLVLLHRRFLRGAGLCDARIALHAREVLLAKLLDVALGVAD